MKTSEFEAGIRSVLVSVMGADQAAAWEESTIKNRGTGRYKNRRGYGDGSLCGYFLVPVYKGIAFSGELVAGHKAELLEEIVSKTLMKAKLSYRADGGASFPTWLYRAFVFSAANFAKRLAAERNRAMSAQQFADRAGVGIGSATDTLLANSGKFVAPDNSEEIREEYNIRIKPVFEALSDRDRKYVEMRVALGQHGDLGKIASECGLSNARASQVWGSFVSRCREKMVA